MSFPAPLPYEVLAHRWAVVLQFIPVRDEMNSTDNTLIVVVVVYLTTNQRHMGYLSSGNGHLAGRYSAP